MSDIRPKAWPDIPECVRIDNWYLDEDDPKGSPKTFLELQRPWTPEDDMRLVKLHGKGLSQRKIADELLRSRTSVARRLRKLQANRLSQK